MGLRRQYSASHVVSYDVIQSCGVNAALLLPILEKQAGWAHCEGIAVRELGQIKFRCTYGDVVGFVPFLSRDQFSQAIDALKDMNFLIQSGEMLTMADMFGYDPPKVQLKDQVVKGGRFIYVFKDGSGLIKIGITIDLKRRSRELYPAEHVASAKVSDAAKLERELHERYQPYRKGGEWFRMPPEKIDELVSEIAKIAA